MRGFGLLSPFAWRCATRTPRDVSTDVCESPPARVTSLHVARAASLLLAPPSARQIVALPTSSLLGKLGHGRDRSVTLGAHGALLGIEPCRRPNILPSLRALAIPALRPLHDEATLELRQTAEMVRKRRPCGLVEWPPPR